MVKSRERVEIIGVGQYDLDEPIAIRRVHGTRGAINGDRFVIEDNFHGMHVEDDEVYAIRNVMHHLGIFDYKLVKITRGG